MRDRSITVQADGSGNFTGSIPVPTSRCVGIFVQLGTMGTGATLVFTSNGRTILTATTPAADKFYPIGELLDTAAGAASTSYGKGGAIVHGTIGVAVTGAVDLSVGTVSAFVE